MAISFEGEQAEAMSDINVTPLVDVMLVLLIIFIITIRVIIQQVPVQLPKATNLPTQTKPENITIAVDKEGDIFWNTQKLSSTEDLKAHLRAIARDVPLDRLLVETDAPYLAPSPFRGKRNEPAYVGEVAKILAESRGVPFEEIARQTTDNFFALFRKVPRPSSADLQRRQPQSAPAA